ncbi:hypothetical protein, partial [Streptomyces brasiliscabiei]|uniref:hypothetical protein n=1 Tax=Streptomyces brasiliscabiei TaxID=2736302 RepID=UPI0030143B0B
AAISGVERPFQAATEAIAPAATIPVAVSVVASPERAVRANPRADTRGRLVVEAVRAAALALLGCANTGVVIPVKSTSAL